MSGGDEERSRIDEVFAACRAQRRAALVGHLTALDPGREQSLARLRAAVEAGVDVLELGVPFSDPTADGPVVNEINTMPGFTTISMYPRMWGASGVDYPTLVGTMVETALARGTGLR